ncbi:MAG: type II toxin-antitoxin system RelE/ParE family toxin [Dongiaceae bacterium]
MSREQEKREKAVAAIFYQTAAGDEPVRAWLKGRTLDDKDRKILGADIQVVEYQWPTISRRNLVKALGNGVREARSTLPGNRIVRILFGIAHGRMVILHGFIKKTQKTPAADLKLAKARWRDWQRENI